tara:strand:+ start:5001 stop:5453 length:453 start_codon:yes stop_codon:yes gene_type:complete
MADQSKHNKTEDELHAIDQDAGAAGELLREIYASLDTTIDRKNTAITDLEAVKSDVATNNAKVGITTAQASAIETNTAKTGITTTQATQLSNLNAGRASSVGTSIKNVTAQITQVVNVNAKTGAATLNSTIVLSNGTRYTLSQTLTKVSK